MAKTLQLKLASPSSGEFPYQKSFPAEMPLVEFKRRIELVVGIYAADMNLTLLNENQKFVCELKQEGQTLEELGVKDNFTVKVDDKSGKYVDPLAGNVEHYKINDTNYQQRADSFLKFKQQNIPSFIAVGNRCTVTSKMKGNRSGVISYVGEVDFKPNEVMIGVTLDEPLGKHDGSVEGKRYFECQPQHGIFVDRKFVKPEIQGELKMPVKGKTVGDTEMVEEL